MSRRAIVETGWVAIVVTAATSALLTPAGVVVLLLVALVGLAAQVLR